MSGPTASNVDARIEGAAQATSGFRDPQAGTCDAAKEAAGEALGEAAGDAAGKAVGEAAGDAAGEAVGEVVGEAAGDAAGQADLDALFGSGCRELRKLFSIGC